MTAIYHLKRIIAAHEGAFTHSTLMQTIQEAALYLQNIKSPPFEFTGTLITAGELNVNGEKFSGLAFEVDRQILSGQSLPLYRQLTFATAENRAFYQQNDQIQQPAHQ